MKTRVMLLVVVLAVALSACKDTELRQWLLGADSPVAAPPPADYQTAWTAWVWKQMDDTRDLVCSLHPSACPTPDLDGPPPWPPN